jgi:hypothetical protein
MVASVNDDVALNRGEDQEQQLTRIGSVEIEVPNEVKKIKVANLTYYIQCFLLYYDFN